MQISEQNENEIINVAKLAEKSKPNVLYFADSLGGMEEEKIFKVIKCIRKHWTGDIGIHAHDNLGKALTNSLFALENQVSWIDSTIMGMGRGPGNVKTELLLLELEKFKNVKFNILPLLKLIKKHFDGLKQTYNWGTNPFYHLAGKLWNSPNLYSRNDISKT